MYSSLKDTLVFSDDFFLIFFIYYVIFTQEYPISAQHCSPWGSCILFNLPKEIDPTQLLFGTCLIAIQKSEESRVYQFLFGFHISRLKSHRKITEDAT